ncbi:PadR family transcriptional regulator [Streptomyces radicis]|uniref:PadR family transcriptional regulator n=1 Tax=Streptomyces radicis TaxID=1750517 RepID=A0A3A9W151_9ACTN|nr:helix-turn-helix transcriptional regulator [Streptomyces radicis]RKN06492.1 PadR family transcriptional regulator [Streptomyces radicis]RKN20249.1 PadR family transcriptional regulator [Streptomyces radicis]
MPPVFGHGRLRLYLLKLLGEAPRHGYEVIRLLEERFQGLYAPSAGTVYPRLAKLAAEGLVTHSDEGGRKVYTLTPEGRRELASREEELTALEREIRDSLAALAADIREDVSGSAQHLRDEVRQATAAAYAEGTDTAAGRAAWQARARQAKEEARRAKEESRRARRDARQAQEATASAKRHFEEAARRLREQAARGGGGAEGWMDAVWGGLDGIGQEIGGWSRFVEHPEQQGAPWWHAAATDEPSEPVDDPERELGRLLDKFRDDVRDAARDHGVSQESLREARRQLSTAAAHVIAMLRSSGS